MADMFELWRSLFKQLNPSTLTAAGLSPYFTRPPQPPPLTRDGDGEGDVRNVESEGERRLSFSSPNRASWANGFDALLGGDPRKNGGDEATPDNVSSFLRRMSKSSAPAWESHTSAAPGWLECDLNGWITLLERMLTRRGLGQTTEETGTTNPLDSSWEDMKAFCWRLQWFIFFEPLLSTEERLIFKNLRRNSGDKAERKRRFRAAVKALYTMAKRERCRSK